MELRNVLEQYIDVSLKLIDSLNNNDDGGELMIEKREELLTLLKESNFSKDVLKSIADELDLVNVEKKIMEAIIIAREDVKKEMIELKRQRDANRTYGAGFRNINFINKKI